MAKPETIGTLATTPDRSVVTWAHGKRQVRALLRAAAIKPAGFSSRAPARR